MVNRHIYEPTFSVSISLWEIRFLAPRWKLDRRERVAYVRRANGCSFRQIGKELLVTRQRARQIFLKAKHKGELSRRMMSALKGDLT